MQVDLLKAGNNHKEKVWTQKKEKKQQQSAKYL